MGHYLNPFIICEYVIPENARNLNCFLFVGNIINSRDIVEGHREKTLSLLWKIIFAFQVCVHLYAVFLIETLYEC